MVNKGDVELKRRGEKWRRMSMWLAVMCAFIRECILNNFPTKLLQVLNLSTAQVCGSITNN
jgi:hypothetical protein